jgi:hypothetical protein
MLAGFWFADPQLRMLAAAPMDRQDDLARRLVDIGDDVCNEGPQEPLASAHADDWRVPGGFQIVGESSEIRHDSGRVRYSHRFQPRLACRRSSQRRFPALLELRGDQPVVGIAGSVAPLGERGLVAGLLQFQLSDALSFALVLHMSPLGLQCRLNRHRLYSTKDLLGDRRIDARASEGQASRQPQHQVGTVAPVDRPRLPAACVDDREAPPAASARQQSWEQRPSAPA